MQNSELYKSVTKKAINLSYIYIYVGRLMHGYVPNASASLIFVALADYFSHVVSYIHKVFFFLEPNT